MLSQACWAQTGSGSVLAESVLRGKGTWNYALPLAGGGGGGIRGEGLWEAAQAPAKLLPPWRQGWRPPAGALERRPPYFPLPTSQWPRAPAASHSVFVGSTRYLHCGEPLKEPGHLDSDCASSSVCLLIK